MEMILTLYVSYLYTAGAVYSMIYFQPMKGRITPTLIFFMAVFWWFMLPFSYYSNWSDER